METVQEALDALACALADHGHGWTPRERALYEAATRVLQHARSSDPEGA